MRQRRAGSAFPATVSGDGAGTHGLRFAAVDGDQARMILSEM